MNLIDQHRKEIQRVCEGNKVKYLFSFGSINTSQFSHDSDVDLLVDFSVDDPLEYADHYFALKFALEEILNRPVDLLENKALKNPYLKESIEKSKVLIYAA